MNQIQKEQNWKEKSISYDEYIRILEERTANPDPADEHAEYYRLNLQRTRRIGKTYRMSDPMHGTLESISQPMVWMVISEPWCGDSAQNLPYLAVIARSSDRITLHILLRDDNPEIMDRYLTNGSRSIPKLIAFDTAGNELFQWGPRPAPAVELFAREKATGAPKEVIVENLHRWYAADRGKTVESEILELIKPI